MIEDLTYYDNTIISNAIQYSKGIQNEYISIVELLMHLEDALTSFILRFYNFARRLIAKLQKHLIFTPVFGLTMGNTGLNAFEINVLLQYMNSSIMFKDYLTVFIHIHIFISISVTKYRKNYHFTPSFGGTMGIVDVNCI